MANLLTSATQANGVFATAGMYAGTCSWKPFVEQTVAMLRDHENDYLLGPGYQVHEDGSTTEQYWCLAPPPGQDPHGSKTEKASDLTGSIRMKKPYKIELIGVTCSPTLAVARGFWRRIRVGNCPNNVIHVSVV